MSGSVRPTFGRDVPWLLRAWAESRPNHPFLVWAPFEGPSAVWTYADLKRDVDRLAAGLQRRGVAHGDRVMIHMNNCPEFVLSWFACATIGAVAVCTNTKSSASDLEYFATHAAVTAVLTEPSYRDLVMTNCGGAKWVAVSGPEALDDCVHFDELFDSDAPTPTPIDGRDPISIQYTSGTTSRPKAVVWTHDNALFGARASAAHEALTADDRQLIHLPLFHTNAQMYSLLATLWMGSTAVLQPRFSASRFWDTAVKHQCTFSSMVPFCIRALASLGDPPEHQFRMWANGVSQPPDHSPFSIPTIGWFGMTETVSHCTVDDTAFSGRAGGMGRAAPEYGVRLVDDDGRAVGVDEDGHLEVLGTPGYSLFAGYLDDEQATSDSYTDDGWFRTGDRARLHEDGHFSFSGREKDMMKVGGENVAAAEVERVIGGVPGITEAAVVSRPHEMLGEVPVAFVLATESADTGQLADRVLDRCRQDLASFKVPTEVRVVSELPRSTLNKVAKVRLRQLLEAEQNSS